MTLPWLGTQLSAARGQIARTLFRSRRPVAPLSVTLDWLLRLATATAFVRLTRPLYYAKNIVASAAGANRLTVVFSPAARYPDVRIVEYSSIDSTTPVDTSVSAVGSSTTSNSGPAVTTNATDLLVGANIVS